MRHTYTHRTVCDHTGICQYSLNKGRNGNVPKLFTREEPDLGEIVGSDWGSAHHFRPTVDHDPVLIGWVNDFIRAKLISYFDGETRFLFDFSGGRFRDALER